MASLRFISFFAGIGGIDLGLERAGHVCVGQVEIDAFRQRVLAKHWPDVPRWSDVRELDPRELPEADLWTAGFPCQDLSTAGKRRGIHGEKSGLFFEFMRCVRKVRPPLILLENVPGLLVWGMGAVLGTLAESGYDAQWDCVPVAALGAPHPRDRVFVIAHAPSSRCPRLDLPIRWGRPQQAAAHPARPASSLADIDGQGRPDRQRGCPTAEACGRAFADGIVGRPGTWWETEPDVVRVVHGVSNRMDGRRVAALGNAVVPQAAEYIGRLLA